MNTVAIMQPTLMPWLGYFALMDSADQFVYLDDVQFRKRSWQSRNRLKSPQGELLVSIPVCGKSQRSDIKDLRIAASHDHERFMKTISSNLGKAPYYELSRSILLEAYRQANGSLSAFNIGVIERIATSCGITTERRLASEIGVDKSEKTIRLFRICQHFDADCYLSAIGSIDYLKNSNPFEASPIELRFQHYDHPEYPQAWGEFRPYMAIVDALSWVGPDDLLELIRSGNRTHFTMAQLISKMDSLC